MTNLEKFEEVFGIKLDPLEAKHTDFPCECAHVDFCDKHVCNCDSSCPAENFWDKEYVEKTKPTADEQIEDFWW